MFITQTDTFSTKNNTVLITDSIEKLPASDFSKQELEYISRRQQDEAQLITINHLTNFLFVQLLDDKLAVFEQQEKLRRSAAKCVKTINQHKYESLYITDLTGEPANVSAFVEGALLSNYQFIKYFKTKEKKANSLKQIYVPKGLCSEKSVHESNLLLEAVYRSRDLVNEPQLGMNTPQFVQQLEEMSKNAGFKLEVFNKKKVETLKMGGMLAVNKGSETPLRFCILEWRPDNAKNEQPIVLVGKGIMYDSGGLSLKPTRNSMDQMKSDMSGAAVVAGLFQLAAKAQLPVHLIGLIPVTDNRINGHEYAPGDVIRMHNGLSVEVMNTDAEGRLILADALSYAKRYNPELVIDIATLTGAAKALLTHRGIPAMTNNATSAMDLLKESGTAVHERIVELPLWEEFNDVLKSDIADLRNIASVPGGGVIAAGKFLEHFVEYPWLHLDIAGMAFLSTSDGYLTKGATAAGLRLLFRFLKNYS